jgi:GTPase SAR1 family protein
MTSAFYNKAQGVVITFDVTQRSTFEAVGSWIRDVRESTPESCCIILCANKVDLSPDLWQVRRDEFNSFAVSQDVDIFECSAFTGDNVKELFMKLGKKVLNTSRGKLTEVDEDKEQGNSLILADFMNKKKKKNQNGCCRLS